MESKRRDLSKLFFSDPTYGIESLVHTPTRREFGLMPFLPEEMEGRKGTKPLITKYGYPFSISSYRNDTSDLLNNRCIY